MKQKNSLFFCAARRSDVWLSVLCVLLWALPAQAQRQLGLPNAVANPQRRVAVVIGNGAYTSIKKLKNPVNDATDVAAALQELGFELAGGGAGLNLTQVQMKQRIREFGNKLRGGGVGVFYYAGHGLQFNGRNYLLPVDIAIENEADVEDSAVDLQLALNNIAFADNGLNIVILDACRNNPFESRVRDARDGLAEVRAATGTLIAYATAPGSVASDGTGRNGAYTEALLKQLKQPGVEVLDMFRQVREEVYRVSDKKQVPWTNDSLIGKFYFKAADAPKPPVVPPANTASNAGRQQSNQYGIEFVAISVGTFTMGSGTYDNEKPAHSVTISQPFEMGKYEVTQEQWQAVMGNNPSYFKGCAKCPVEQVSWEEAQQFIGRLNGLKDGYTYRLPTEAEWEYAARAGMTGDYAGVLDQMGWYYENAGDKRLSDGSWSSDNLVNNHNKTHPVGMKSPNVWRLYDMHGNVWEWVQDWYNNGYYGESPKLDPTGPSSGSYRVFRGCSWYNPAVYCRSAFRLYDAPSVRYGALGLRLARTR